MNDNCKKTKKKTEKTKQLLSSVCKLKGVSNRFGGDHCCVHTVVGACDVGQQGKQAFADYLHRMSLVLRCIPAVTFPFASGNYSAKDDGVGKGEGRRRWELKELVTERKEKHKDIGQMGESDVSTCSLRENSSSQSWYLCLFQQPLRST